VFISDFVLVEFKFSQLQKNSFDKTLHARFSAVVPAGDEVAQSLNTIVVSVSRFEL
jgi:hypothetical protein